MSTAEILAELEKLSREDRRVPLLACPAMQIVEEPCRRQ